MKKLLVTRIQEKSFLLDDLLWNFFINSCFKHIKSQHCTYVFDKLILNEVAIKQS